MTAETLKPFITPATVDHFPVAETPTRDQRRPRRDCIALGLSATCAVLTTILIGITLWQLIRVTHLESDVKALQRVVESMQKRLGLDYLGDLQDFEKEYSNALIDDPTAMDEDDDTNGGEDGEKDDASAEDGVAVPEQYDEMLENYDDLDAMVKKYNSYDSDDDEEDIDDVEDRNASDDDNLYDDFEKYKDSKKKLSSRKARSIATSADRQPMHGDANAPMPEHLANNNDGDDDDDDDGDASHHQQQQKQQQQHQQQQQQEQHHPHHPRHHPHHRTKKPLMRTSTSMKTDAVASGGPSLPLPQLLNADESMMERRHGYPRQRSQRKRKIPLIKSGESATKLARPSARAAAHFHLNRKVNHRHAGINVDSYRGDMYIGEASWFNGGDIEQHPFFAVNNGVLTVREPGLYYVYAQVCYNNTHDQNGFVIFHGHRPHLQCLNTVPTNMPLKIHTCHTSGLIYLQANETIHLRDFHTDRNVVLKETNNRSYFGLIKI